MQCCNIHNSGCKICQTKKVLSIIQHGTSYLNLRFLLNDASPREVGGCALFCKVITTLEIPHQLVHLIRLKLYKCSKKASQNTGTKYIYDEIDKRVIASLITCQIHHIIRFWWNFRILICCHELLRQELELD